MNATRSENTIAAEDRTGMGRRYGPDIPPTNAMGRMAAMTVSVASTVGFPTSATAWTASSRSDARLDSSRSRRRTMFSTTTIASSTRMPIEKISAKSVIRLIV